jgi:hypothetical protein
MKQQVAMEVIMVIALGLLLLTGGRAPPAHDHKGFSEALAMRSSPKILS